MTTTQSPSYNNNLASIGGKVGRAAGMLTGVGALGFVGGAVGLGLDAYNANQELAEHQTPALGFGDVASAALNNATFGLAGQDINAAKAANYIDYWGPGGYDGGFAGPPVGWDAFGGFEEAYGYGDFTGTDETGGGWGADPSQTGFDESYGYGSFDGMDETGGGWGDGSDSSDSSGGGGGGNGTGGTGSGTSGGAGSDDDDW